MHNTRSLYQKIKPLCIEAQYKCLPEFILQNQTAEVSKSIIEHELEEAADHLDNLFFAEEFRKYCYIPTSKVEDYLSRIIEIENLGFLFVGLHFKNLEIHHPFIEIYGATFELNESSFKTISNTLKLQYKNIAPLSFRFGSTNFFTHQHIAVDHIFYASTYSDLSLQIQYDFLEVERVSVISESEYERYKIEHEIFFDEFPHMRALLSVESMESLNKIAVEGELYKLFVAGDFAGFIGVKQEREKIIYGNLIVEEILFKKYRGKNYAADFQRKVLKQIEQKHLILFGSIDAQNIISQKVAKRLGRKEIYYTYFYTL